MGVGKAGRWPRSAGVKGKRWGTGAALPGTRVDGVRWFGGAAAFVEQSLATATALAPIIGYEQATALAKQASGSRPRAQ
jgi:hypothetical protein